LIKIVLVKSVKYLKTKEYQLLQHPL